MDRRIADIAGKYSCANTGEDHDADTHRDQAGRQRQPDSHHRDECAAQRTGREPSKQQAKTAANSDDQDRLCEHNAKNRAVSESYRFQDGQLTRYAREPTATSCYRSPVAA